MLDVFLARITLILKENPNSVPPQILMLYHNDCMYLRHVSLLFTPSISQQPISFTHYSFPLQKYAEEFFTICIVRLVDVGCSMWYPP
jgi:hypothetical protein